MQEVNVMIEDKEKVVKEKIAIKAKPMQIILNKI